MKSKILMLSLIIFGFLLSGVIHAEAHSPPTPVGVNEWLRHIPWWIYIVLVYWIFVGLKAIKTNIVAFKPSLINPVVFLIVSIYMLYASFAINGLSVGSLLVAILIGTTVGYFQVKTTHVIVDKDNHLLKIPGTFSTLTLILIIVFVQLYLGYELANDPKLLTNTSFEITVLAVQGGATGLFIGRTIGYLKKFKTEKSVDLKKK